MASRTLSRLALAALGLTGLWLFRPKTARASQAFEAGKSYRYDVVLFPAMTDEAQRARLRRALEEKGNEVIELGAYGVRYDRGALVAFELVPGQKLSTFEGHDLLFNGAVRSPAPVT